MAKHEKHNDCLENGWAARQSLAAKATSTVETAAFGGSLFSFTGCIFGVYCT